MYIFIDKKKWDYLLKDRFSDAEYSVTVHGSKPYLHIYTSKFSGKTHEEQQQMVRDILKKSDIGIDSDDIEIVITDNPATFKCVGGFP